MAEGCQAPQGHPILALQGGAQELWILGQVQPCQVAEQSLGFWLSQQGHGPCGNGLDISRRSRGTLPLP